MIKATFNDGVIKFYDEKTGSKNDFYIMSLDVSSFELREIKTVESVKILHGDINYTFDDKIFISYELHYEIKRKETKINESYFLSSDNIKELRHIMDYLKLIYELENKKALNEIDHE